MVKKYFLLLILALSVSGCTQIPKLSQVTIPLLTGWYEGKPVYYVTTDVSDKKVARQLGANYAPRLSNAIPNYPKPPQIKTILERVYAFPQGEQKKSVFASIPNPLGHESEDLHYSPVWLMYIVEWQTKDKISELRSEGDIFNAEVKGLVKITRTNVVINCPIVSIDGHAFLPRP